MASAAREIVPVKDGKARKVDGRRNNGGLRNPPGGRPTWKPTPQKKEITVGVFRMETQDEAWQRMKLLVQHYTAIGYPQDVVARLVNPPCEPDTLRKHFAFELDNGKLAADAKMAGTIYQLGVT